jgi:hypothetical protein
MKIKTILTWAAVAFTVWWMVQQPAGATHLISNIWQFLNTVAAGFSRLVAGA